MRLKKALLTLVVVLGVTTTALALSLKNGLSLGFANSYLETRISQILDRDVIFADPPHVQIDSGLKLSLSNISLANVEWADDKDLAELRSLKAHIDLWSLFEEQAIVHQLTVNGLSLHLHQDSNGNSNLPTLPSADEDEMQESPEPGPPRVAIKHIQISDVFIERRNDVTGNTAVLVIESLEQDAPDSESLRIQGRGSLQGRPWQLAVDGSSFRSIQTGRNLSATFSGALGSLTLQGDYAIPNARDLRNLKLNAALSGPIPPRIAEMSPLLEADKPADISLKIEDIDPGLDINLSVELPHLAARLYGDVDDPGSSDGVDLDMQINADSLERVASALGLGPTEDVPLTIRGRLLRHGKRIEFRDTVLEAGDNQLEADVVLPAFPGTNGGTVKLSARGPSFAFYQRLLRRKVNLEKPYHVELNVQSTTDHGESVQGDITVGAHTLYLSGVLNNFPNYAGSDLSLSLDSPSLSTILANVGIEVPDTPARLESKVSISDDAVITIHSADILAYGISGQLRGQINSYPHFDSAAVHFSAQADSLAKLGQRLGLEPLGELPVALTLDIEGRPEDILVRNPQLRVGGLELASTTGALRYADKQLSSDLQIQGTLSEVGTLLGQYSSDYVPKGDYKFMLTPALSAELFTVELRNLSGPGVRGDARLQLSRDFKLNEKTVLQSDLHFDDISQLLPADTGYDSPPRPLTLRSVTRPGDSSTRIEAELLADEVSLLTADIRVPAKSQGESVQIALNGSGDDLQNLGSLSFLPRRELPYDIAVTADIKDQRTAITAKTIALGSSIITGTAQWDNSDKSLLADLQIPKADLQAWMKNDNSPDAPETAPPKTDGRRIPDVTLPLRWLHDYQLDVSVKTGPLGLVDPQFSEQSLIEQATLSLESGDGRGMLTIEKLEGSRGVYEGELSIEDTKDSAEFVAELAVGDMPLGIIASGSQYDALPKYDARTSLTGSGDNLRALAASLNGEFYMTGGAGTLQKMKLSAATESFVAQVFQTLLPMLAKGQTNMEVECSVLAARAADGMLSLDPGLIFRSEQIDLSAHGQVNLDNEKLDISFNSRARKGLGISAASVINPFVAVTGTLAKPTLGLDIASSALSGGAAVASAGVTIFAKPLLERIFARGNPCEAAVERWNESAD